jgi:subtilisin family serine protease/methionine-rich copper-binding protein CopC
MIRDPGPAGRQIIGLGCLGTRFVTERGRASVALVLLTLLTLLAVQAVGTGPPSVAAAGRLESLDQAVAAGRLDIEVLGSIRDTGQVDAIVSFDARDALQTARRAVGARAIAEQLRAELRQRKGAALELLTGEAEALRDFEHLASIFARFRSERRLLAVLNSPGVAAVHANLAARPSDTESGALIGQPDVAAQGYLGTGTAVAVLDTGVDYSRTAFGSCSKPGGSCKVAYARDFAADDGTRDDSSYHGTNVAGIVLSVAPGTRIIALDVFRSDGLTTSAEISAALDWLVGNQAAYDIRAVNLSLGGGAYAGSCAPDPGFDAALAVGITPVVAAGNSGSSSGIAWPACVPGAISVGAVYDADLGSRSYSVCSDGTTTADKIACFSQSGSNLTMLAPGSRITAAGLSMAGTSQATPHVAGAAAVLAAASPSASQSGIRAALAESGRAIKDPRNGLTRRRLDLGAAVAAVTGGSAAPTPTPTPSPADTTAPKVSSRSPGANATGVSRSASVKTTFSEAVKGVSATTFRLRDKSTGASVSATVTYDSSTRTATLNPGTALGVGRSYTASLTSGIADRTGNKLAASSWTFTTATSGDTTRPKVKARTPAANATGVSRAAVVTVTFNEPVRNLSGTTFKLASKSTGGAVSATVTYDATTRRATLKPARHLAAGTSYVASVTNGVTDRSGNRLAATSWTFTTAVPADTTAPTVELKEPPDGATEVARRAVIRVTFSEAVKNVSGTSFVLRDKGTGATVDATVAYDVTTRVATLTPDQILGGGRSYSLSLTNAITDQAGNPLVATSWTFTTGLT